MSAVSPGGAGFGIPPSEEGLGELHPRVQSQHSVRCHICHARVQTALCGLEKSHAAQVALSAP